MGPETMYRAYNGAAAATLPAAQPNGADPYAVIQDPEEKEMLLPMQNSRFKLFNVIGFAIALFAPWVIYCVSFAWTGFSAHYRFTSVCVAVEVAAFAVIGAWAALALYNAWRRFTSDERAFGLGYLVNPDWYAFLAVTSLMGLAAGCVCGHYVYKLYMEPYYDVENLYQYSNVDPSRMHGQEIMDAGQVAFVPGTRLDVSRSMGFRNQDMYCAAPITGGAALGGAPLDSYDFWAVGLNCCSSGGGDFACGQAANPQARGGLRLMRDDQRAFFRLAVQQSMSAYALQARHPLFFEWVEDPALEHFRYELAAFRRLLVGMFCHGLFQCFLVFAATYFFENPMKFIHFKGDKNSRKVVGGL